MKAVGITHVEAICNLGHCWSDIWHRLLRGESSLIPYSSLGPRVTVESVVAAIAGLDRRIVSEPLGGGASYRLADEILRRLALHAGADAMVFGASNHGESDVLTELVATSAARPDDPFARDLFTALDHDVVRRSAPSRSASSNAGNAWVYSACSSGLHALALAVAHLTTGETSRDAMIVAADALSALGIAGFYRAGALCRRGCAPFDRGSDGLVVGEGAAGIVLRLADVSDCVTIVGLGATCDAAHPTQPDPSAQQLERAIRKALHVAELSPADVGLVVAHGTGTTPNDLAEAAALVRVFGRRAVPVTSIKGMIGHCMGAAGLFNVLTAERALSEGVAPAAHPTRDPVDELDVIVGEPRVVDRTKAALVLASGFGGNNVACAMRALPASLQ